MARLRQAVARRPRARARRSPPLPAPRGHRPPPHRQGAGWPRALSLPPPTPRPQRADHDAGGAGVSPPLSLAGRAPGLAAYAPYGLPGQPGQGAGPPPGPPTAPSPPAPPPPSAQPWRRAAVAG